MVTPATLHGATRGRTTLNGTAWVGKSWEYDDLPIYSFANEYAPVSEVVMPSPGGVGILENPSFCDPIRYLYFCCNFGPCPERLLFYISSVLQIFDRDLLSPGYTADGWTAFWIYCDRTLLLLTLGVVTYLIIDVLRNGRRSVQVLL